jgi:UDP-glucose 4-epimerase
MAILVTGGAGYIGSHCVRILDKAGYDCIIYDNLSEGHRAAVQGFELVVGELSDTALLDWTPAHSDLREIVTDAWLWHKAHPNGYQDRREE